MGKKLGRTVLAVCGVLLVPGALRAAPPPPVELTAEEDQRRMLDLLGIEALRPGRNGIDPNAANFANYDEAKANPFPHLPDPLTLKDGRKVTTADEWWRERRPEIVEDFDSEIYGRAPNAMPAVTWAVVSSKQDDAGGRPVLVRELVGEVDNSAYPPVSVRMEMTLTLPARAKGPVPAIIHLAWRWPPGMRPPGNPPPGPTPREQVIARGWAYAEFVPVAVQEDTGTGLTRGIIGLSNKGRPRKLDDWGVLRAWAWGASRALDYFETDESVDAARVGIEGLSRYGKAVLVAMAYDPRFAVGLSGSSGAGGASLLRRDFGEVVENLAGSGEYHWMAGNFLKYAGPLGWDDLPVDAHELIALAAPRPLFIGSGTADAGDAWVDPKGMFLAAEAASPVYELLGAKGLGRDDFPPTETSLTAGELAFRQHSDGHTNGPNWPYFLDFAARYLDRPQGNEP